MISPQQLRRWQERLQGAWDDRELADSDVQYLDAAEELSAVLDEMHEAELEMRRVEARAL